MSIAKVQWIPFEGIFEIPLRNGLNRPTTVRGQGVKMVNMGELFANPRISNIEMERVPLSESEADRFLLRAGDLLFARQSLVYSGAGKCSIFVGADEPITYEGHIIRARLDRSIADPHFYFYLFNSAFGRGLIETIIEQVAAAGIRGSDLAKLEVPLPPLSEQHKIARILGALDDKIELNRRMNATLEATAHALFQSWFVDFDPVHAKAEGQQPEGMDAETAALFPDGFEDSGLGLIPRGWEVVSVGDVVQIRHGYAFEGQYFSLEPSDDILLTPGNFAIGGGFKGEKYKYYSGPVPEEYILQEDDLLVTMTDLSKAGDTLGYPALIPKSDNYRFLHNQRLGKVIIKPTNAISKLFLYYLMRTDKYRQEILGGATGSTVKHTSPNRIQAFAFVLPSPQIMKRFSDVAISLYSGIKVNEQMTIALVETRDGLLPKLMSGELQVGL